MKEIHYELCDDGGSNAIYLPIIMPQGTYFHHEYGRYKVSQHVAKDTKGNNEFMIICDRVDTNTHSSLS